MRHRLRNRIIIRCLSSGETGCGTARRDDVKPDVADATDATEATDRHRCSLCHISHISHHRHRRKISHLQGIKKDPVGNNTAQGLTRAHGLFYKVKPLRKMFIIVLTSSVNILVVSANLTFTIFVKPETSLTLVRREEAVSTPVLVMVFFCRTM